MIPRWLFVCRGLVVAACTAATLAHAEPYSFEAAADRLNAMSDNIAAAQAGVASKADTAEATRSLNLPVISLDAQLMRYQKTVETNALDIESVSVGGNSFAIPSSLPNIEGRFTQNSFRPTLTGMLPLYTGGRISAVQQAARAAVDGANAELGATRQAAMVQLVERYFGQQLAKRVLAIRRDVRDGMQLHLDHAVKLQQAGMITLAQKLQAQVALDATQRAFDSAQHDLDTASMALGKLLHTADTALELTSPLFISIQPLPMRQQFLDDANSRNPAVLQLEAMQDAARQKVKIEEAASLPTAYLFGSYNLNPGHALPIEPDWIVGVGVHFPLFSGMDRKRSVSAARNAGAQVDATLASARTTLSAATHKAWNDVENAREQSVLLESSLTAAHENLRAQELAFKEGQGTSTDVVDARLLLGQAQTEQAAAAWLFDVSLARLLDAAGQVNTYASYIRKADKVIQ